MGHYMLRFQKTGSSGEFSVIILCGVYFCVNFSMVMTQPWSCFTVCYWSHPQYQVLIVDKKCNLPSLHLTTQDYFVMSVKLLKYNILQILSNIS